MSVNLDPLNPLDPTSDPSYYDPTNPQSPYYDPTLVYQQATAEVMQNPQATGKVSDIANEGENNANNLEKLNNRHRRHMRKAEEAGQNIVNVSQQPINSSPDQKII